MVLSRLPSSTAVYFSGPGEVYAIKHDITDVQCLMPGLLLAIREVVRLKNLIILQVPWCITRPMENPVKNHFHPANKHFTKGIVYGQEKVL
ncbi:hypothetical protein F3Y22_tig00110429pilonHSYRG00623 [Hibiscus syriacus]|uniref:Dihydrodipicolinate reductase C-terminal domain-containing protein n=1 Tax=Hibiscus syriacus TaxID=106335 RepID=A0A6A3APN0_HIBSY|nr:hypothetical protein F3Y22_tig00110429pilonHSYRG00623 [Hibiscus syriacus]